MVTDLLEKIFPWATSYSAIQNWRVSPEKFGQPSIGKVTRRDGLPSKRGVQDYLVEHIEFGAQYTRGLWLIDFGECKSFIQASPHQNTGY